MFVFTMKVISNSHLLILIASSGYLYSWGARQIHLGHSMPADDEQDSLPDYLVPQRVKSKNLESAHFHAISAGTMFTLTIATLNHN